MCSIGQSVRVDAADAYIETKSLLVAMLDESALTHARTTVPATPDWGVLDVVAHVTGLAAEAAAGTLPSDLNLLETFRDASAVAARDDVAERQVLQRRDRDFKKVIAEWDRVEPGLVAAFRSPAGNPGAVPFGFDIVLVTDLCVHADDIANALGRAPFQFTHASKIALGGYCFAVDYRIRQLGLPSLMLRYDGKDRQLGDGTPAAVVTATHWTLLRVLAGRRSRRQILSLDWDGDPEPYLHVLPAYGERSDDLHEATDN